MYHCACCDQWETLFDPYTPNFSIYQGYVITLQADCTSIRKKSQCVEKKVGNLCFCIKSD